MGSGLSLGEVGQVTPSCHRLVAGGGGGGASGPLAPAQGRTMSQKCYPWREKDQPETDEQSDLGETGGARNGRVEVLTGLLPGSGQGHVFAACGSGRG